MKKHDDSQESPTMREVHRIQDELEQQYQQSGLSYLEWLQATEADFKKSLAEDGFHMVTRNGETFIEEIEPPTKSNKNNQPTLKAFKPKNYDDSIKNSAGRELQCVREERTAWGKVETPPQRKPVKYKTAAKRYKQNSRKK